MKRPAFYLLAAVVSAACLSACKTQRTEKWTTRDTEVQKLQKHFAGNFKLGKDEMGNGRMVKTNADGSEAEDSGAFIGRREFDGSQTFSGGNRNVDKKAFDTGLFSGKKDMKKTDYHFIKAREQSQQASSLQDMRFSGSDSQSAEGSKKWFQRDAKAETGGFFSRRKKESYATQDWYPAAKATKANEGKDKPILALPGRETGSIQLKDIKEMLGRAETIQTPGID